MSIFKKNKGQQKKSEGAKAVVLLKTVREGMIAEKALLKNGFTVRKVAPPPEYRKGCEIAVEIDLIKENEVEKILSKYGIKKQGIIPL